MWLSELLQAIVMITHGAPTTGDPAVVALALHDPCTDTREVYCTGTLVAPRVVLTAAHCVDAPLELVEVFFGADVAGPGVWLRAAALRKAASFDPSSYDDDIGAVILGEDAPVAAAPMQLAPLSAALIGSDARIVGFGIPEPGAGTIGLARSGLTTVSSVEALRFEITPNPAMSCQVDSGGPVLLVDDQGIERVAGITSTGDAFCEEFAVNTRVDAYMSEFVTPVLDEAQTGTLGVPPPLSTDACPGCAVLGCGEAEVCDAQTDACVPAGEADAGHDRASCQIAPTPTPTWTAVLGLLALTFASHARSRRPTRR